MVRDCSEGGKGRAAGGGGAVVFSLRSSGSTLGPPSSNQSSEGFLPDQGLDCTFRCSTPCRPRSLQRLILPLSPEPHTRKLRSRRQ